MNTKSKEISCENKIDHYTKMNLGLTKGVGLMEYKKNPSYGKTKCFRCLLSPDREEAAIFVGINKVISRTLDTDSVSVYPCKILNRFACPYDKEYQITIEDEDTVKRHQKWLLQ